MKKLLVLAALGLGWSFYYTQRVAPELEAWNAVSGSVNVRALVAYLEAFPNGSHAAQARDAVERLRSDDAPFDRAATEGTSQAFERFLQDYPGHRRETVVRAALDAGDVGPRDLLSLLEQGKIDLAARGDGIEQVHVRLRRRTIYPLVALLPAGLLYVPGDRGDQTMIATEPNTIRLSDTEWHEVDIAVACTNWSKDVPGSNDEMAVRRSTNDNLNFVAPLLVKTQNVGVRQALVWIMSDNTDYDGLGKLVTGCFLSYGCTGTRVIGPTEAAEAMQILVQGGLDLRQWAIWRDRSRIYAGLEPGDLQAWFAGRVR